MKFCSLLLVILLATACQRPQDGENSVVDAIHKHRLTKDRYFAESENSPLPDTLKPDFKGLSYFPVDLSFRFRVPLVEYQDKAKVKIATSSGVEREAQKVGFFRFEMESQLCSLQVYKLLDIQNKFPNYLFVPFLDKTSGQTSYGGGRYLDLQVSESGIYNLDFNFAYNPSCAYGKSGYNCPIPPVENRLDVAVLAGEKVPSIGH